MASKRRKSMCERLKAREATAMQRGELLHKEIERRKCYKSPGASKRYGCIALIDEMWKLNERAYTAFFARYKMRCSDMRRSPRTRFVVAAMAGRAKAERRN